MDFSAYLMIETILVIVGFVVIIRIYYQFTRGMCVSEVKMSGKVVIITGSNTGIGFVTAEDLAKRGAKVILACRDPKKGLAARDQIMVSTGNKSIVFKPLDLSSFKSVREFAEDILRSESRLDVLINNAGTAQLDNSLTRDNLPIEAQVNHFSPFLLTMLLLPLLKSSAPSRIINVASLMYILGSINDLDKQSKYLCLGRIIEKIYCNTKLANMLFTRKLSKVLKDTGVTVNCLHPGAVRTEILRNNALYKYVTDFLFVSPQRGAQTSIYLAVDPDLTSVSGEYFSNCRRVVPWKNARDDEAAEKLWQMSERAVFNNEK